MPRQIFKQSERFQNMPDGEFFRSARGDKVQDRVVFLDEFVVVRQANDRILRQIDPESTPVILDSFNECFIHCGGVSLNAAKNAKKIGSHVRLPTVEKMWCGREESNFHCLAATGF